MSREDDEEPRAAAWENFERTWEDVQEDESGQLKTDVRAARAQRARRRRERELGRSVRRGMIRYTFVVIDLSAASRVPDVGFAPSRAACVVRSAKTFIRNFFFENPISQLGVVVARDGRARKISQLGGNPRHHLEMLDQQLADFGAQSAVAAGASSAAAPNTLSLQNALELAMASLRHVPAYGLREALLVISSISTCDPGDIFETLARAQAQQVVVSVASCAAELHIAKRLCDDTGGTHRVARDATHLNELLSEHIPPPVESKKLLRAQQRCELMQMGFPQKQRYPSGQRRLCWSGAASGFQLCRHGYRCPRCWTHVAEIPSDCPTCGLRLVSSPMLARSYHHLFPVPHYQDCTDEVDADADAEVGGAERVREHEAKRMKRESVQVKGEGVSVGQAGSAGQQRSCFGCMVALPVGGVEPCFRCPTCGNTFCSVCDAFVHETLHNCPSPLCSGTFGVC